MIIVAERCVADMREVVRHDTDIRYTLKLAYALLTFHVLRIAKISTQQPLKVLAQCRKLEALGILATDSTTIDPFSDAAYFRITQDGMNMRKHLTEFL